MADEVAKYCETLDKALANKTHNDKWAERADPNHGPKLNVSVFMASDEFTADYVRGMKERYNC